MRESKINEALLLLSIRKGRVIQVREAVEIIELVTKVPEIVKEVLDVAEQRGIVERKPGKLILKFSDADFGFKTSIRRVQCSDSCRKCGRKINYCYFIKLENSEIGPFGSTCIKKLRLTG